MSGVTDPTAPTQRPAPRALPPNLALDATRASGLEHTLPLASGTLPSLPTGSGPALPDDLALSAVDPSHYVVGRELARGGMGRIRVATDRRLGRQVAIKEILVRDGELAQRFEREARITARLQHPSIVAVYEAGLLPTGMPFYAMPLMQGRSLDEEIAKTRSLSDRMALVPSVLAVADAMAYAHGERVIHRDLKPRNVLIGAFGETVVIDWGLAKDLDAPNHVPAAARSGARTADPLETELGEVMGTPAYMPPEQAEGGSVDARADVYAIGALLVHVLTGRPPYEGRSVIDMLEAVKTTAPAHVLAREPNAPTDLVTIIDRAMARDPDARYPTARELAADLRRFQTGQLVGAHRYTAGELVARWFRKHRTAVSVAALAAVVLVVVGIIAVRNVVQARGVAEARRGDAEGLTEFMLFDLRARLDAVGRLDLLEPVATRAAAYYASRGPGTTVAERAKSAMALSNIGDVLVAKGRLPGALAQFRAALAVRTQLATAAPESANAARARADAVEKVADVLVAQGELESAVTTYRDAVSIIAPFAGADIAADLARLELRIAAQRRSQGNLAEAQTQTRDALAKLTALAAAAPTNRALQRDLLAAHRDLATVLYQQSDLAAALTERRAALAITERLASQEPSDAQLQHDLALVQAAVGEDLRATGDNVGELAALRASLVILARLVDHDPANALWQADLAASHIRVDGALRLAKNFASALDELRTGISLATPLLERDASSATVLDLIGGAHADIGTILAEQGKHTDAVAAYERAIVFSDRALALDGTNHERRRHSVINHGDLARSLIQLKNFERGEQESRTALAQAEQLAALDPTNAWLEADVANAHTSLGMLFHKLDAPDRPDAWTSAVGEYRAALAIQEALAARDPANIEWPHEVGQSHYFIGNAFLDHASAHARSRGGRRGACCVSSRRRCRARAACRDARGRGEQACARHSSPSGRQGGHPREGSRRRACGRRGSDCTRYAVTNARRGAINRSIAEQERCVHCSPTTSRETSRRCPSRQRARGVLRRSPSSASRRLLRRASPCDSESRSAPRPRGASGCRGRRSRRRSRASP